MAMQTAVSSNSYPPLSSISLPLPVRTIRSEHLSIFPHWILLISSVDQHCGELSRCRRPRFFPNGSTGFGYLPWRFKDWLHQRESCKWRQVSMARVRPATTVMSPFQPVGTVFNPPRDYAPQLDGLRPGAVTEMYSYDHI